MSQVLIPLTALYWSKTVLRLESHIENDNQPRTRKGENDNLPKTRFSSLKSRFANSFAGDQRCIKFHFIPTMGALIGASIGSSIMGNGEGILINDITLIKAVSLTWLCGNKVKLMHLWSPAKEFANRDFKLENRVLGKLSFSLFRVMGTLSFSL